jgi:hypothetical protein
MARKLEGTFIGFCGAGGTGKTTTAKLLASQLHYGFLPSASRDVFKRMGYQQETDQDKLNPNERWLLQRNIQVAHMTSMSDYFGKPVVTDRTQLDQHAYALLYCSSTLSTSDLTWLHDLVERALQFYKKIFYFPLTDFPTNDDRMRTTRQGERLAFDCILYGLIRLFDVPITVVPVLGLEDRVEFIEACLHFNITYKQRG